MDSTLDSTVANAVPEPRPRSRTSDVLRGILTKNPGVTVFSVELILASIGNERFEASLTMFAAPALVPVAFPGELVAMPTGMIAGQLIAGRKQIKLPNFILKKTVTRKSLAIAIQAIAPVLEAAERLVKPRWSWVNSEIARRAIGLLLFLLAVAIVYPFASLGGLHSASIIAVALGMAEQDGLAIVIGVVAGVLSLVLLAASGLSVRTLGPKLRDFLRGVIKRLGIAALARTLERMGYPALARLVTFRWSELVLLGNPEPPMAQLGSGAGQQPQVALGLARSRQAVQIPRVPRVDEAGAQVGEQSGL